MQCSGVQACALVFIRSGGLRGGVQGACLPACLPAMPAELVSVWTVCQDLRALALAAEIFLDFFHACARFDRPFPHVPQKMKNAEQKVSLTLLPCLSALVLPHGRNVL